MSTVSTQKSVPTPDAVPHHPRKPRADGIASRDAILHAAAALATTKGFAGLSFGELADQLGMSKSGLYAHFGSKEELELAIIQTAIDIFQDDVVTHINAAPPGLARLRTLADSFLSHVRRRVFPGGCFFAALAAELDTRPGRARDQVAAVGSQWLSLIDQCLREAVERREISPRTDRPQAVFELDAMLLAANYMFVMQQDNAILTLGRRGVEHVIERIAPAGGPTRKPAARRPS